MKIAKPVILFAVVFAAVFSAAAYYVSRPQFDASRPFSPEPTYEGRKMGDWIMLTKDNDSKTRLAAYEALGKIPQSRADLFRPGLADDDIPETVFICATEMVRRGSSADEVIPSLRRCITRRKGVTVLSLEELRGLMGPKDFDAALKEDIMSGNNSLNAQLFKESKRLSGENPFNAEPSDKATSAH